MLISIPLFFLASFASAASLSRRQSADGQGYVLPDSGVASTTQFNIGSELGSGTSCGANALADGSKAGGSPGGGPGYLYAAINQLGFGANPGAHAGGPGGACGVCYQITPMDNGGNANCGQSMIFKIIDECPVSSAGSVNNCNQCSINDQNVFGHAFHFDIAVDAMNQQQYNSFYQGVTDGSNWNNVRFQKVACTSANADPQIFSWGCLSNCKNNPTGSNCGTG